MLRYVNPKAGSESKLSQVRYASPTAITVGITIAVLYFGRDILVPLAMAVLLSFLLAPVVAWLERLRMPRIPAVVGAVALAFVLLSGFGTLVAGQLVQLAQEIPDYQTNLEKKIKSVKFIGGPGGIIGRTSEMLQELGDEAAQKSELQSTEGKWSPTPQRPPPLPVQIEERPLTSFELVKVAIGPLVQPLATAGIILVFMIFMLIQRRDIRDRFIRLVSAGDLTRTTQALEDAGERVARYLLMQLIVNVAYGVPVGIGLWLIGVPYPLLWGMMATVLRFVPYIGPILAATLPIALSIAVDPGWSMLLWTAVLFIVLELTSNNIVEPWLYGSQTGLSPIAIILAAIFWTWLWGPLGLLLSTPLTVCLVVLGRHVPQFEFLHVLLGSDSVLTPEESLHQRLLAADSDEATELAEVFLKERSLEAFYQEIALPTLIAIERDRAVGLLDDHRRQMVTEGMFTLLENLSDHKDAGRIESAETDSPAADNELSKPSTVSSEWKEKAVLCVGARGSLDDVAAAILAQLLQRRGIGAQVLNSDSLTPETLGHMEVVGVRIVVLSYMNEDSITQAKYMIRRLRRRTPKAKLMIGFWSMTTEQLAKRKVLDATQADLATASLADAVDQITAAAVPTVRRRPNTGTVVGDTTGSNLLPIS